MSFFSQLKEAFTSDRITAPSTGLHVIDLSSFGAGSRGGDRLSPRDRVNLLQKIASFVEREQLNACILIEGRPLREAPEGESFKTAKVVYAETGDEYVQQALKLAAGGSALLITQNRELERQAQDRGIRTLRASSLRRAMDENGRGSGGGGGGNGGGGGGRSGGNRSGRRRSRSRRGNAEGGNRNTEQQAAKPTENAEPKNKKSGQAKDGVSDLIDLV